MAARWGTAVPTVRAGGGSGHPAACCEERKERGGRKEEEDGAGCGRARGAQQRWTPPLDGGSRPATEVSDVVGSEKERKIKREKEENKRRRRGRGWDVLPFWPGRWFGPAGGRSTSFRPLWGAVKREWERRKKRRRERKRERETE